MNSRKTERGAGRVPIPLRAARRTLYASCRSRLGFSYRSYTLSILMSLNPKLIVRTRPDMSNM